MLSIPSVTSWISDNLGEYFWSLLAPSLLSIPLVTILISVDLGEHFWSLLGPSVLSIPLVTSWIPDASSLALLQPPGPFQYSIGTSLSARSVFSLCSLCVLCGLSVVSWLLPAAPGCSWPLGGHPRRTPRPGHTAPHKARGT